MACDGVTGPLCSHNILPEKNQARKIGQSHIFRQISVAAFGFEIERFLSAGSEGICSLLKN